MPFLRFSRDKRGYEHTYLVQATNRRGKPVRPRVLYWYRTPPGVKVGRPPFDDEVRRTLEAQNPGVVFDWKTIVATPFPPPEPESWRDRRRAERAAKVARTEEESPGDVVATAAEVAVEESVTHVELTEAEAEAALRALDAEIALDAELAAERDGVEPPLLPAATVDSPVSAIAAPEAPDATEPPAQPVAPAGMGSGRRRRRRRRRGHRPGLVPPHAEASNIPPDPAADLASDSSESDDD